MKTAEMNVELVDQMGSDLTVVNAARVSFDKASDWEMVEAEMPDTMRQAWEASAMYRPGHTYKKQQLSERDTKLIKYLADHNHWSPFAHTSIQLRIKAPIFVARQLVKHQVGGVWNEVSRRYVDSEPEFWFPEFWRGRPEGSMKQGSGDELPLSVMGDESSPFCEIYGYELDAGEVVATTLRMYNALLKANVAPEQARMILPQNMMTEWYWTGSLMFFARVCRERLAPSAQAETRQVAKKINDIAEGLFPVSWDALLGNQHGA